MANEPGRRPRRLLHVFATFDAGGPQVRTIEVCRRLGASFTHGVIAADGRIGAAARITDDDRLHVVPLRRPASSWRQLRSIVPTMRAFAPDLVLTYNWGAILGAIAARLSGVPFVHHEEVVPPEERHTRLARREWLRRMVLPRAAAVVVPSAVMARRACARWCTDDAALVRIDNGVELAGRQLRRHQCMREPIVGTVANARPEKNWSRLLHAFALLRDRNARLLVVGDGPERGTSEQLARDLGIVTRTRFLGAVDDARPCYDCMDVFVLASDDEQMPLAILEAMAHGLPVVATDVGDVAAMLPAAQRRFLFAPSPASHQRMAAAIDELLTDVALRQRLGAANRDHVEGHFDLRHVAARYRELYLRHAMVPAAAESYA